jgi:hypothetical protein
MFISNLERIQIRKDIEEIAKTVNDMNAEILFLTAKVKTLEYGKKVVKKTSGMTLEGRAKMSQMMKDRHAKNKLEKANATSISTTSI